MDYYLDDDYYKKTSETRDELIKIQSERLIDVIDMLRGDD